MLSGREGREQTSIELFEIMFDIASRMPYMGESPAGNSSTYFYEVH